MDVIFLSETRMKKSDADLKEVEHEWIYAPIVNSRKKGFGRTAIIANSLLRYEMVAKIFMGTMQSLTIRVRGLTITGIYVSPHTKEGEEREVLKKIEKMSRGKGLIIGDVNAQHKSWNKKAIIQAQE